MHAKQLQTKQLQKNFLHQLKSDRFHFYCVGCNRERRLNPPARVGSLAFYVQILLTTAFFTLTTYPWLGLKGFAFAVIPIGFGFEAFYRLKMRQALVCPDCDFDPILYLVDQKKAAQQVENAWRKKFAEKGIEFKKRSKKPQQAGIRLDGMGLGD